MSTVNLPRSLVRTARSSPATRRQLSTSARRLAAVEQHDIVVVGGGPAGLALAAALASSSAISSSHKVTLLEASPLDKVANWAPPPGEWSNRVSSITADNVAFLNSIGAWPHLDLSRTRGVEEMQVWDGLSNARINFSAPYAESAPYASTSTSEYPAIEPMATLVENLNLQRGLLSYLKTKGQGRGGVELVDRRRVVGVQPGEGGWPVVEVEGLGGGEARSLRARLLIGADGYNSPVRTYSKIDTFGWMYNIHGVVGTLQVSAVNGGEGMSTAWQRFLPEGPIAFLPLSPTTASLVWSTTPALAAALKALPLTLLPSLINSAFSLPYSTLSPFLSLLVSSPPPPPSVLADAILELSRSHPQTFDINAIPEPLPPLVEKVQEGSIASFPLRLSHADTYLGLPKDGKDLRTVLVGDAAHTVNPLAGQGLNMGLGDVQSLVATLEQTVRDGGDVGSYNTLRSYPRSRYLANHAILSTTDHLSSLYGSKNPALVWARSTGLEIVNELDGLKSAIMGGAGAGSKGPKGAWATVAGGLEGVAKGVEVVKGVGGMLVQQIAQRIVGGVR